MSKNILKLITSNINPDLQTNPELHLFPWSHSSPKERYNNRSKPLTHTHTHTQIVESEFLLEWIHNSSSPYEFLWFCPQTQISAVTLYFHAKKKWNFIEWKRKLPILFSRNNTKIIHLCLDPIMVVWIFVLISMKVREKIHIKILGSEGKKRKEIKAWNRGG